MTPTSLPDFDDEDSNTSGNPHFNTLVEGRLSRRGLLLGSAGSAAVALLGGLGLSACGGGGDDPPAAGNNGPLSKIDFSAVGTSLADVVAVPAGYTASVVYALGDPLAAGVAAYGNLGNDDNYQQRAGDHHDGMEPFALGADGRPSSTANDRVLLALNHEATTDEVRSSFFLHANGGTTTLPRPAAEVDKEVAIHGVSVVEMRQTGGRWAYVQASTFNRRLTALRRYGRAEGAASRHGWETGGAAGTYARWSIGKSGVSANGSDDYRNEMNGMGYIVEVDAHDPASRAKKRTALGRFAHESAAFLLPAVGEKLAIYRGDDSRNEYIYKFVSDAVWSAADATPSDRLAAGAKYMDAGKLYVAKFNDNGTGQRIELSLANTVVAG